MSAFVLIARLSPLGPRQRSYHRSGAGGATKCGRRRAGLVSVPEARAKAWGATPCRGCRNADRDAEVRRRYEQAVA
jgi:hypothetical protein